jgi:hypothetical protein
MREFNSKFEVFDKSNPGDKGDLFDADCRSEKKE